MISSSLLEDDSRSYFVSVLNEKSLSLSSQTESSVEFYWVNFKYPKLSSAILALIHLL